MPQLKRCHANCPRWLRKRASTGRLLPGAAASFDRNTRGRLPWPSRLPQVVAATQCLNGRNGDGTGLVHT